jgi:excisionase family DNA binding protein
MKKAYSTIEVAQRLGVSVQTVQRWVDGGQLRAWKTLGGHRRIEAASADALFDAQAAGEKWVKPPVAAVAARPLRVLVVDDDEADRELAVFLVSKALPLASIVTAASGFEALMQVGRDAPDVLVTDVMMPHMNGFEMLAHLAGEATRPGFIVATSSHSASELAAIGELPDGVAFIAKPIDRIEFATLLQTNTAPH